MIKIFSEQDRQKTFEYILSVARSCDKIISLVQVGSGAIGYHDARSDLDFVVAMDSNDSMLSVMDYIHQKIAEKYEIIYFKQVENYDSHTVNWLAREHGQKAPWAEH